MIEIEDTDSRVGRVAGARGFATLETLLAATLIAVILLSIATMFLTAHASVERSGDTTIAVGLARRLLEVVRSVPFGSLLAFDGLDTANPLTLPADEPERDVARRWRYALAGEGDGWTYTAGEKASWPSYAESGPAMRGQVKVTAATPSRRIVTVTLTVPGRPADVELTTMIARTDP